MRAYQEREAAWSERPVAKVLAHGLYFLAVTALFICLRLPATAVKEATERALRERMPQFSWHLASVSVRFPLTVVLAGVELSLPGQTPPLLAIDRLALTPAIMPLLQGAYALDYHATLGQGTLSGSIALPERSTSRVALSAEFNDLELSLGARPLSLLGREVSGKLKGSFHYHGRTDWVQGEGKASLVLKDGGVGLAEPVFGLTRVDFEQVLLDLVLQGSDLAVKKGNFRSRDFSGEVSGTVQLNRSLPQSPVQLDGRCELFPSFFVNLNLGDKAREFLKQHSREGKVPFLLHGALSAPQFTLK